MTSDEAALLRAICLDPADDGPRLIYADWLEEQGRGERAEFIRVQVEVARMVCSLPLEPGEKRTSESMYCDNSLCRHCMLGRREGEILCGGSMWRKCLTDSPQWHMLPSTLQAFWRNKGVGPFPEMAETPPWEWRRGFIERLRWITQTAFLALDLLELFGTQPTTEVVLIDRHPTDASWWAQPSSYPPMREGFSWYRARPTDRDRLSYLIPPELWDRLDTDDIWGPRVDQFYKRYPTEADALAALSRACVAWGRECAGLPPLPVPAEVP